MVIIRMISLLALAILIAGSGCRCPARVGAPTAAAPPGHVRL